MTALRESLRKNRKFLPIDLDVKKWSDLEEFASALSSHPINNIEDLKKWLSLRSEFDAVLEEDKAWLYIRQSCNTDNQEFAKAFTDFVQQVEEKYAVLSNALNQKLIDYCDKNDYPEEYEIFIRGFRSQLEIFREKNVVLQSELEVEEQQYGSITGGMTIEYKGEEHTLQSAQNFLKSTDREERKTAFNLIWERRRKDADRLNALYSNLLEKRNRLAKNADFDNYLQYRFVQLGRFDYAIKDCEIFHDSVRDHVVPYVEKIHEERRRNLDFDVLRPYDLEVDEQMKPALTPFRNVDELIQKSIACFSEIDSEFGRFIAIMKENGYLDLDSRKGKAPGGYNYPLHESNVPFIFMNATNNLRDMETMMHEGGHAIHSFLSKDQPLVYFKDTPAEIAEVASMAMELISMEHWQHFFTNEDELLRAKRSQLEGVLSVLPWVATIDKFQHWLYTHPGHSVEERTNAWNRIHAEFSGRVVSWEGLNEYSNILWQKQIHLFQFPLYYIEYGIAQLGSIAIWRNYKSKPKEALKAYREALSLGYSVTLSELYKKAGVEFNFSGEYIRGLVEFVWDEYQKL